MTVCIRLMNGNLSKVPPAKWAQKLSFNNVGDLKGDEGQLIKMTLTWPLADLPFLSLPLKWTWVLIRHRPRLIFEKLLRILKVWAFFNFNSCSFPRLYGTCAPENSQNNCMGCKPSHVMLLSPVHTGERWETTIVEITESEKSNFTRAAKSEIKIGQTLEFFFPWANPACLIFETMALF